MNLMATEITSRRVLYQLFIVFLGVALGFMSAGYFYFENQKKQIKQDKHNELAAIADLKVNAISWWRKERLADGAVIARNPLISRQIRQWLERPGDSKSKEDILTWMKSLEETYDYSNVSLIDPQGKALLSVPEGEQLDAGLQESPAQWRHLKTPSISNLYRSGAKNTICLCIFVPILNLGEEDTPVIAVLLLQIDPYEFFYPLVQSWPTPSRTSESLLVYREGDEVVYLNDLRHRKGSALSLRLPLSDAGLPAAMAARGQEGVAEGVDYRGVPVLASMRAITGTPWFLVAKVDREEIYGPIHESARTTLILVSLLIAFAGVTLALVWNHQHKQTLQRVRDELDLRVQERTAELGAMNEALQAEITVRKLAEEALRESEQKFREVLDNSLDAAYRRNLITDAYDYMSPAFAGISGYTPEEMMAMPFEEVLRLIHPDDAALVRHRLNEAATGDQKPSPLEYRFRHKDGSYRWFSNFMAVIKDSKGNPVFRVGNIRDITGHKQAEERIRRAKSMLQAVFNGISDPLLMVEKDLTVRMLNEASLQYFQVSSDEDVIGKACYDLAHGRCAPCDECVIRSAISEETSVTFQRKGLFDPEHFEQVAVYPAQEAASGFSGVIIRISDITESKNLERQVMRADRLSSLGQLSGGIAHEIRNPLSGINLFVDILSDEEKFTRTSQELDILDEIKRNIIKINGIIKRVLDFSRKSDTALSNVEIGTLIEDTLKLWHSRIRTDGIELSVALDESLPKILGDPVEMQQVLNNLVQNAIEAMSKGGVLSITAQNGVFSFDKTRPAVTIKIQDAGEGIPPEKQKKVFNPFFTTKPTGTGLGLAISHRIVERHGGAVWFESTPKVGTTFCVELPVAPRG